MDKLKEEALVFRSHKLHQYNRVSYGQNPDYSLVRV